MIEELKKHLIGKEDLLLDTTGTDVKETYEYSDSEFDITALNASHLPIRNELRETFNTDTGAKISDVDGALTNIENRLKTAEGKIEGGGGGGGGGGTSGGDKMTADTTLDIYPTQDLGTINNAINNCIKNLGGHILTINLANGTESYAPGGAIIVKDFYNGMIRFGGTAQKTVTFDDSGSSYGDEQSILCFERCFCGVTVQYTEFYHRGNTYGVCLKDCPGVYFYSCTFDGDTTEKYAVYYHNSSGKREGCSLGTNEKWGYLEDGTVSGTAYQTDPLSGYVTDAIAEHSSAANTSAHSNKANLASPAFSGTPTVPTMDSTETATQQIANAAWVQLLVTALKNKYLRAADQGGGSASSEGGYLATRGYVSDSLAAEVIVGTNYVKLIPRGDTSGIGIYWGCTASTEGTIITTVSYSFTSAPVVIATAKSTSSSSWVGTALVSNVTATTAKIIAQEYISSYSETAAYWIAIGEVSAS